VEDAALECYRAYGLDIRSPFILAQLQPGEGGADIVVRLGSTGPLPEEPIPPDGWGDGTPDRCRLIWPGVGAYLVSAGSEIVVAPSPGVPVHTLSHFLTGPVLATALVQRGFLILHASAVDVAGHAVLFAGHSGSGKSTMAGAMLTRGHRLVADDISAIDLSGDVPHVLPGFPHQKLWPDSAEILGLRADELPLLVDGETKRGRLLEEPPPESPLPLRRLYLLEEGDTIAIEPVVGLWAFVLLSSYSYASRLLGATGQEAVHFQQCTDLIHRSDLRRLVRPRRWERLSGVVEAVERDLSG
jgi:hypothetical protein